MRFNFPLRNPPGVAVWRRQPRAGGPNAVGVEDSRIQGIPTCSPIQLNRGRLVSSGLLGAERALANLEKLGEARQFLISGFGFSSLAVGSIKLERGIHAALRGGPVLARAAQGGTVRSVGDRAERAFHSLRGTRKDAPFVPSVIEPSARSIPCAGRARMHAGSVRPPPAPRRAFNI